MSKPTNHTGLNCPKCQFTIKFSIDHLLSRQDVICPSCGLIMQMNVPREIKMHLQEISLAEKMVRDAQTFSK